MSAALTEAYEQESRFSLIKRNNAFIARALSHQSTKAFGMTISRRHTNERSAYLRDAVRESELKRLWQEWWEPAQIDATPLKKVDAKQALSVAS